MSRLDDELKLMFQRQEPCEDFAERVLARIQAEAQPNQGLPKPGFWQTLVSFFQPQGLRWALAAAAILVIAILGFVQYQRLPKNAAVPEQADVLQIKPDDNPSVKEQPTPKEERGGDIKISGNEKAGGSKNLPDVQQVNHKSLKPRHQHLKYVKYPSLKNEEVVANHSQQKSEGEIAKEQLLKALAIASATINEAKKLAMGGTD
jgi:hypothetical protein